MKGFPPFDLDWSIITTFASVIIFILYLAFATTATAAIFLVMMGLEQR